MMDSDSKAKMNEPLIITVTSEPIAAAEYTGAYVNAQVIAVADIENPLLPWPTEGKWHFDEFERCCSFKNDCWMAWCCGCFSLGQIIAKLRNLGVPYCVDFQGLLCWYAFFFIADVFTGSAASGSGGLSFTRVFLVLVAFQLRGLVRARLSIPGSCCNDFCCALCCTPCVITQMVAQLWKQPEVVPGCNFTDEPGGMP
jgi:Cys-rich protein (TIGR01571 family)